MRCKGDVYVEGNRDFSGVRDFSDLVKRSHILHREITISVQMALKDFFLRFIPVYCFC